MVMVRYGCEHCSSYPGMIPMIPRHDQIHALPLSAAPVISPCHQPLSSAHHPPHRCLAQGAVLAPALRSPCALVVCIQAAAEVSHVVALSQVVRMRLGTLHMGGIQPPHSEQPVVSERLGEQVCMWHVTELGLQEVCLVLSARGRRVHSGRGGCLALRAPKFSMIAYLVSGTMACFMLGLC